MVRCALLHLTAFLQNIELRLYSLECVHSRLPQTNATKQLIERFTHITPQHFKIFVSLSVYYLLLKICEIRQLLNIRCFPDFGNLKLWETCEKLGLKGNWKIPKIAVGKCEKFIVNSSSLNSKIGSFVKCRESPKILWEIPDTLQKP